MNKILFLLHFHLDTEWKQLATTIAGGNAKGDRLDQLFSPFSICIDENDQTVYIADWENARIMEWTINATNGRVVVGRNGQGNETNQLSYPTDVIIDSEKNSLIIADAGNRRVMRWCEGANEGTVVVCNNGKGEQAYQLSGPMGLSFNVEGNLYVADCENHRIQKFAID